MKRMISAVLILALAAVLCACGEEAATKEPASPYVGAWTATAARYEGTEIDINEVFSEEFVLELQDDGVCRLTLGEQSDPATWSAEDGNITISDGETDLLGTIDESTIVLEISAISVTLTKEGAGDTGAETEEASEEVPAEEAAS